MSRATSATGLWNALIRTHHITSRKKVAKLRQAAEDYEVYALICYGGCPGVMYTEGAYDSVKEWVEFVRVSSITIWHWQYDSRTTHRGILSHAAATLQGLPACCSTSTSCSADAERR